MDNMIPQTRDEAVSLLVDMDVARWGEGERDASKRLHRDLSYGLALTEIANRAELADKPWPELRKAANKALTGRDWDALHEGG